MRRLHTWPVLAIVPMVLLAASTTADEIWFAGVASLPGANNTRWRSEVVLYNPTTEEQNVRLELRPRGFGTISDALTLGLAASEVRRLSDLYAALGAGPGSGLLRVDGAVLAWVRTFNQGEPGTFGQDVPPVRVGDAVSTGEKRLVPAMMSRNTETGFRSNLLLLNLGGVPATFMVRGCGATHSLEIAGGAYEQLNNLGGWLGCPDGAFIATVEGSAPWYGYVSTIDPFTGDPTTVRAVAEPITGDPGNRAPVVHSFYANPAQLVVGGDIDLRGTFSDPDGDQVGWSLRIDPGATARAEIIGPTSGTGALVSKVRTVGAGMLLVQVTVTDGRGGVTTAVAGAVVLCQC